MSWASYTQRFFERAQALAPRRREALRAWPEAEASLRTLVERAREAWPQLEPANLARFFDHLAQHASQAEDLRAYLGAVRASDLYLACAAGHGEPQAIARFEAEFMREVPSYVLRLRLDRASVEEVQQKLRESLLFGASHDDARPKLLEYAGKGALGGWLRIAAVRLALNQRRSQGRHAPARVEVEDEPSFADDPELANLKGQASALLAEAFAKVMTSLEPRERTLLRLHYLEGVPLDRLSALVQIPRSTLGRRLIEVRQKLFDATQTLLCQEKKLSPSAAASMIRVAQSQLQVSMSRLLQTSVNEKHE